MNASFYRDGWVPQTQVVSGFGNDAVEKLIFKRQVEQDFSSFFGIFDDFSKFCSVLMCSTTLKNHHIWQK